MSNNTVNRLLTSLMLLLSFSVMALPEDTRKPIHISADTATPRNDQTGITIYKGDVELSQGSMRITGQHIELRQTNNGVSAIIAKGGPAHFQQRPAKDKEITHAYGQTLDYNIKTKELNITGQAKVSQGSDSFSGNRIVYDMNNSTVKAFGDNQDQGQRVQMIIQPKAPPNSDNAENTNTDTKSKPDPKETNPQ